MGMGRGGHRQRGGKRRGTERGAELERGGVQPSSLYAHLIVKGAITRTTYWSGRPPGSLGNLMVSKSGG